MVKIFVGVVTKSLTGQKVGFTVRLDEWLKRNERSQGWLARKVRVHASLVSRWLSGERFPTPDEQAAVALHTDGAVMAEDWTNDRS